MKSKRGNFGLWMQKLPNYWLPVYVWVYGAMQALGRNPEAKGAIQINMILSIVLAEAVAIYALVVAILLAMVI
jgi:hypothetical protein